MVTRRNIAENLEIRVLTLKFTFFAVADNSEKVSVFIDCTKLATEKCTHATSDSCK